MLLEQLAGASRLAFENGDHTVTLRIAVAGVDDRLAGEWLYRDVQIGAQRHGDVPVDSGQPL